MKLLKYVASESEDGEKIYSSTLVMESNDLYELKSKASDLCTHMGFEASLWTSRFPIPGNKEIKSNKDWVMNLENGICFVIE